MKCQYCAVVFMKRCTLLRHQRTARYCLKLRAEQEKIRDEEEKKSMKRMIDDKDHQIDDKDHQIDDKDHQIKDLQDKLSNIASKLRTRNITKIMQNLKPLTQDHIDSFLRYFSSGKTRMHP